MNFALAMAAMSRLPASKRLTQQPPYNGGPPSRCEGLLRIVVPPFSAGNRGTVDDPLLPLNFAPPPTAMPRLRPFSRGLKMGEVGQHRTYSKVADFPAPARASATRSYSRITPGQVCCNGVDVCLYLILAIPQNHEICRGRYGLKVRQHILDCSLPIGRKAVS